MVLADPTHIHQILINLCSNAAHAMDSEGGILSIQIGNIHIDEDDGQGIEELQPGDYVQLKVRDSGHGMSPEVRERIFDPYFTTKEQGKGTGMGLSVVHGIVHSYQGASRVSSEPGRGSEFTILLPRVGGQSPLQREKQAKFKQGNEHILFVDDEAMIADMANKVLTHLGYRVTTRTSSIEALEAFRDHPGEYDLVISDLTMPNMTGDRLAARLLEIRSDIPIILCSGFSSLMAQVRISDTGVRALLNKPLSMRELSATIRSILD
jgi:CheY-like chemotaxis protein